MRYKFGLVLTATMTLMFVMHFTGDRYRLTPFKSLGDSHVLADMMNTSARNRTAFGKKNISWPKLKTDPFLELKVCQQMRLNTFRRECRRLRSMNSMYSAPARSLSAQTLNAMSGLVDDQHSFVSRVFTKTGCTSWKTILYNNSAGVHLDGVPQNVHEGFHQYGLHRLRDEPSVEEMIRKLENYFVMLNVRHPLDRLESAYRDKFLRPTPMLSDFLKRLHKDPRYANTSKEARDGTVTFKEFLDLVIDERSHDMHWKPYLQFRVCNSETNYIAKTESSVADMSYIIKYKLSNKGTYLATHSTRNGPTPKTAMALSLFSQLPNPLDYIDRLLGQDYGEDMRLFGYGYRVEGQNEVIGYCETAYAGLCC